ncbi:protein FAR1-RELATED SEQUENCE 5-like [Nymphaea colorata]|nr:protein FAR1-RELATED SEQUENCE 5-like [Nymphaea colorata]XP_031498974.1 protein FAR1-RELATED SEQUENCE 5-like [Nymphaea colorata]XP_031498975.1 protein FAR1-RELATED SEQUENCE 5-like [Nymphaea colorata]XP_031498976.1 protein FAR1-RELATED SEQUENCE 5-like [Nymphaea colorata]
MDSRKEAMGSYVATKASVPSGNEFVHKGVNPMEPYVGMGFESEEAARIFYNEYAKCVGFSMRVDIVRRSRRDSQTIGQQFVCSEGGFHSRKRPIAWEGCKAMIRLKKEDSGKWVVTRFEKDHNHELVPPGKVSLPRPHFQMAYVADNISNNYGKAGICQSISHVGEKSGGSNIIGFNSINSTNSIPAAYKRRTLERDAQNVLDYFKHQQAMNPAFFYAIQADEQDHITNVFWADARSKMAYSCFGDMVTFDVTYRTNVYGMPFTLFTGVDHHKHAVLFGCGLLLDESEASLVWLFNTWLKAMSGRYPDSLVTDESPAIAAAMAFVFPRTHHRLCKRHILRKFPDKLGDVGRASSGLREDFFKCINMTVANDEFDSQWRSFIDKYELQDNQWLQSLYKNRDKWIQVYFQDVLLDNMPKTQISETISMFFDVDDHTTLMSFINQCENAVDSWYEKELVQYYKTGDMKPYLKMGFPMENQVAEIYTKTIFLEFQEQLVQSLRHIAEMSKEDGPISTFKVVEFGTTKGEHTVTFNALEVCAICSCQMFEYAGILCRHILRVFIVKNVMLLPPHYIIKRWTRNAMNGDLLYDPGSAIQIGSLEARTSRYDDLCREAINFAAEGAWNLDICKAAKSALQKAFEEMHAAKEKVGIVVQHTSPVVGSIQDASICERD